MHGPHDELSLLRPRPKGPTFEHPLNPSRYRVQWEKYLSSQSHRWTGDRQRRCTLAYALQRLIRPVFPLDPVPSGIQRMLERWPLATTSATSIQRAAHNGKFFGSESGGAGAWSSQQGALRGEEEDMARLGEGFLRSPSTRRKVRSEFSQQSSTSILNARI